MSQDFLYSSVEMEYSAEQMYSGSLEQIFMLKANAACMFVMHCLSCYQV